MSTSAHSIRDWLRNCFSILATLCFVSTSGSAATLNVVGDKLMGASGVDVGGTLYDVEFSNGTCADLFSGCAEGVGFNFTTQNDALVAAQALLDTVFVVDVYDYDGEPRLTNACGSTGRCTTIIPYARDEPRNNELQYAAAQNDVLERDDYTFSYQGHMYWIAADPGFMFSGNSSAWNWAVFTPTPVPEPSTALLVSLGLVGLAGRRKRSRLTKRRLATTDPSANHEDSAHCERANGTTRTS